MTGESIPVERERPPAIVVDDVAGIIGSERYPAGAPEGERATADAVTSAE
jgi:hypothetical protein